MAARYRDATSVRVDLQQRFSNLTNAQWVHKSPWDDSYQCIAWAACDTSRKWWPIAAPPELQPPEAYWPPDIPREETVECFVQAFTTLGYRPCEDARFEFGYQKVAIYADADMRPTHMARQHFLGRGWLSKLGDLEDILHLELTDVEGDTALTSVGYGRFVQVLKRNWWAAAGFGLFRGWWAALRFWLYRLAHP